MSKRTRGSARAHRRPGTRPPTSRPAGARPLTQPAERTPAAAEPTPLELAPELAEERAHADAARAPEPRPVRTAHARPRAKPGSLLAARAATEYTYVAQDLRRIAIVSFALLAIMLAAWLAIGVFRIIPLDFY